MTKEQLIIASAIRLIEAIKKNEADLWIPSLECTIECVILNEETFGNMDEEEDDHPDFELYEYKGIAGELSKLEELLKDYKV